MMKQTPAARFINPFTDFGFKKIFGSEPNKDLLIDLLNALFEGRKVITDISYRNTEHHGREKDSRTVIFDILCTGDNGELFLIEMQKIGQEYFKDRCLYYSASLICDQVRKGDKGWGYQLKETYLIGMMDFCFEDTPANKYIHHVQLVETESCRVFYERLGYIFIEIPKFRKPADRLHNAVDQWLFVLRHMHGMRKIPVFLKRSVFLKLFNIAEMSNLSTQERKNYDVSLKRKWDWENSLKYARKQATEKGLQEGLQQGLQKGLLEAQRRIAQGLKKQDIPPDIIASATGLTVEEVEAL